MRKQEFNIVKETAELLAKYRKKANLSQTDIAKRMGLSVKSGFNLISRLEKAKIRYPYYQTILSYLNACNVSWTKFFGDLSNICSTKTHREIMTQVKLPENPKLVKKINRDVTRYTDNIKTQYQPTKLDYSLIKNKVERKIRVFLVSMNTDEKSIKIYLDFCFKVMGRELSSEKNQPVDEKLWIRSGIRSMLLPNLRRMVVKIVSAEQKKAISKKPPSSEKQKKMALGYARYLANIEPIEAEVHKMLCYIVVPEESYRTYKSFARACYKIIHNTGRTRINDKISSGATRNQTASSFDEAVKKWVKMGLREDILEKVRDLVVNYFKPVNK